MIDAAGKDAMDALAACPCCLLGPQQRCLKTPYTHLDNTEIYSDMLKECFNIELDVASDKCGICEECVVRLRDASHFKRQVQLSQRELLERLAKALKNTGEAPPAVVTSEMADEDGASDDLSVPAWRGAGNVEDSVSVRARAQLAMTCSVRLERLRGDEAHESSLARHMDSFEARAEEQAYTCDTCGQQFTRKPSLVRHVQGHTATADSCQIYKKQFTAKSTLITHGRIHTGLRAYSCNICNKQFTQRGTMNRHGRIHTGHKPFSCDICNRQFSQKGSLNIHVRIHTGLKPYSCDICNKQFSQKGNLQNHITVHSDQKPYICIICNKKFRHKCNLQTHVRIHTEQRPFSCDICNMKFRQKVHLQRHITVTVHTGLKPYIL